MADNEKLTAPGGGHVVTVAGVDDHPIIRDSLRGWVTDHMLDTQVVPDIRVIATAATVDALLAGPGRHADVVLLDLDLGDGTTVDHNVRSVIDAGPAVLVLSASDRPLAVRGAMRAGAIGYVMKNDPADEVRAAIRAAAAGQSPISPRLAYIFASDDDPARPALSEQERRALALYATGLPLKSVARKMSISEETAREYIIRVRNKYAMTGRSAHSKLELYHRAMEDGHLPSPPT